MKDEAPLRPSGREPDEMRAVRFVPNFVDHAEGSVLAEFGGTRVLVTASVEKRVPPFLKGRNEGWVTAEYGMLPRATHTRSFREAVRGKQAGRTVEIQRLIGRSLRAVVDRSALGERTVTVDCDVLQADGGTRTAAITGGYVALALAVERLRAAGKLKRDPIHGQGRRGIRGHLPGRAGSGSRLPRGLRSRDGHERGDERRGRIHRVAGNGGGSCLPAGRTGPASGSCLDRDGLNYWRRSPRS